jgi:hypothetical protein
MIGRYDQEFFEACESQLNRMDLFFKMKIADAQRKQNELGRELDMFKKTLDTAPKAAPL